MKRNNFTKLYFLLSCSFAYSDVSSLYFFWPQGLLAWQKSKEYKEKEMIGYEKKIGEKEEGR